MKQEGFVKDNALADEEAQICKLLMHIAVFER